VPAAKKLPDHVSCGIMAVLGTKEEDKELDVDTMHTRLRAKQKRKKMGLVVKENVQKFSMKVLSKSFFSALILLN